MDEGNDKMILYSLQHHDDIRPMNIHYIFHGPYDSLIEDVHTSLSTCLWTSDGVNAMNR